eukprot:2678893-Karenia_brevis.AAC.1
MAHGMRRPLWTELSKANRARGSCIHNLIMYISLRFNSKQSIDGCPNDMRICKSVGSPWSPNP